MPLFTVTGFSDAQHPLNYPNNELEILGNSSRRIVDDFGRYYEQLRDNCLATERDKQWMDYCCDLEEKIMEYDAALEAALTASRAFEELTSK